MTPVQRVRGTAGVALVVLLAAAGVTVRGQNPAARGQNPATSPLGPPATGTAFLAGQS